MRAAAACRVTIRAARTDQHVSGGIKLGAWHVLPAGDVALDASARIADGSSTDATFDALLNAAANASEEPASGPVAAIYLHGSGERRGESGTAVERAKLLSSHLGLHVLLIDYRGFGDSDGYPDEEGLNADAAAALTWLTDRGVKPQDVIVWGHSLGTGPAVQLASSQEVRDQPLRGLILEAPYTSMVDAATTLPPNFLIRTLPFGTFIIRRYFYYQWANLLLPPTFETPALVFHGTADCTIPFVHTVTLARACLAASAQSGVPPTASFVPLIGCNHLDNVFHPMLLASLATFPPCRSHWRPSAASAAAPSCGLHHSLAAFDGSLHLQARPSPSSPSTPLCKTSNSVSTAGRRAAEATPAWLRQAATAILPPALPDRERSRSPEAAAILDEERGRA